MGNTFSLVLSFALLNGQTLLTLRNQDNVARRVKVYPPDSPFFELLPSRREATGVRDKVAPGMEVTYVVRFKPDARIDYSYDLKVVQGPI